MLLDTCGFLALMTTQTSHSWSRAPPVQEPPPPSQPHPSPLLSPAVVSGPDLPSPHLQKSEGPGLSASCPSWCTPAPGATEAGGVGRGHLSGGPGESEKEPMVPGGEKEAGRKQALGGFLVF